MGFECANAIGDTEIFGVVPMGRAIVTPIMRLYLPLSKHDLEA